MLDKFFYIIENYIEQFLLFLHMFSCVIFQFQHSYTSRDYSLLFLVYLISYMITYLKWTEDVIEYYKEDHIKINKSEAMETIHHDHFPLYIMIMGSKIGAYFYAVVSVLYFISENIQQYIA